MHKIYLPGKPDYRLKKRRIHTLMIESNGYKFDFSKWKMRDVIAFQANANDLEVLFPMVGKAMVQNPFGVDLASPTAIDDVDVTQWAAIQKEFSAALTAVFQ